jgi:hypothetical protein
MLSNYKFVIDITDDRLYDRMYINGCLQYNPCLANKYYTRLLSEIYILFNRWKYLCSIIKNDHSKHFGYSDICLTILPEDNTN